MDNYSIINLKLKGFTNLKVAKILSINKKTVAKYWNKHLKKQEVLRQNDSNTRNQQEKILDPPKYDSSKRKEKKYTKEMNERINDILADEKIKQKKLGANKQKLTKKQIYQILKNEGHDISYPTVVNKLREKSKKIDESFIRQEYEYGDRLEYDFGEVKLEINDEVKKYYLAVLSSPASNFRWAYIYDNQKKEVFLDSHVKFFEMVKGVYREVVYDNMRNVVTKFLGKNEKELNEDLLKMAIYYEYSINVTNCYRGNEKGHVEGSVKIIRNEVFAPKYSFNSFDEVEKYLEEKLIEMNKGCEIKEEMKCLREYKPKLEIADISKNKVNKYSFIQIDNNNYSVPEYLVNNEVIVKSYFDKIYIYSNNSLVCEHKRIDGRNNISIDIRHYLRSMKIKPGSIKNSAALKNIPELKSIYDNNFITNPKKFIEILTENKEKSIDEIIEIFNNYLVFFESTTPLSNIIFDKEMAEKTRAQVFRYDELCIRGDN